MNSDATEAALGLLGLSPLNAQQSHPQPQPHPHHHVAHAHGPSLTSSSVGIAIDRASTPHIIQPPLPPSLVPLKRKQPSPSLSAPTPMPLAPSISGDGLSTTPRQSSHPLAASSTPPVKSNRPLPNVSTMPSTVPLQRQPQQRPFSPTFLGSVPPQTPPTSEFPLPSPSASQHPLSLLDAPPPPDSDAISCVCGFTYDDGFSIACDDCSRWCHAACFGIVQGGEVPEFWKCWVCDPALEVDKERAVKTQKGRLKAMRTKASHGTNGAAPGATVPNGTSGSSTVDEGSGGVGKPPSRRKSSPGAERKSRRGSAVAAAIEGSGSSKKKSRASMLSPADPSSSSIHPTNHTPTQSHPGSSRISHPNDNNPAAPVSLPPTPVTFPPDICPNPSVYSQLLRAAKAWRGVTALNPPSPLIQPPPRTYNDGGYKQVDSQGYRDRYGYSMSPLDNTTPVILDENAGDVFLPRTVLRTDPPVSSFNLQPGTHSQYPPASTACTPAHLRPPSPRLHVASDPSPFSRTSIYPSPPISNYMSPPVPSSSHPRPYSKSPLTPSTNTIPSSNPNDTIPATTLLAPYTATIVPSAAYLADPLNGYAHLGMGKPQVRLIGGGWGVGLDARAVGGVPDPPDTLEKGSGFNTGKEDTGDCKAKWARCGCWPNAVVRPVICGTRAGKNKRGNGMCHQAECAKVASDGGDVSKGGGLPQTGNGGSVHPMPQVQEQQVDDSSDQDDAFSASDPDVDSTSLSFALFALRDLRADEEIVLGWEWDDGHAVHMLPALMESPGMFAPAHLHHLRAQFTSILHALSSTFTTCACGSSTRDCAVRVMESVVEGRWPWPGGEMTSEGSEDDSSDVNGASEEWDCDEGEVDVEGDGPAGPRLGRNLGLGMNVDVDVEMGASIEVDGRPPRMKKRKVRKKSKVEDVTHVGGSKDASATAPAIPVSTLKPKSKKAIDLGPLVGIKRGFRTREKVPMNGGWGGVEIVPSSLKAYPEVTTEEDTDVTSKGKGKARVADGDEDDMDVDTTWSTLPPRMRKAWSRLLPSQLGPLQANPPQNFSKHERWRSPPGASAESPISAFSVVEGSSAKGDGLKQGLAGVDGCGEDGADGQETEFDTETEADGSDDTRQMPPPPMPASLDPTTVSSLARAHAARSSSPRGPIQWDKNGASATRPPQQSSTPTPGSSGQSNQPLSQGTYTTTPTPDSNAIYSPVPSQGNNGAISPLTSFPLAVQAQTQSLPPIPVQSHPLPLIPSVSPSATFSKLSLHSPDASSSSHLSMLFNASESTSPPFASASMQHCSDHRVSPPPLHTPSEPMYVRSQSESPLPASHVAPTVTLNSPDGTRDTPAEAQYQHPYRPSPESGHEAHLPLDAEKRRLNNGEAHRVRFASPEVLRGLPRLRGRATSGDPEPLYDNTDAKWAMNKQDPPLDRDVMDVDVVIVGDDQMQTDSDPSHVASPEVRATHVLEDKYPSLNMLGSPHPQVISDYLSSSASENDLSPFACDVNETSQTDAIVVELGPAQPAQESSPPPPPKVKMSLKDFALRKRKQREEEMAKALRSPTTPDCPGLLSSPCVEVKREFTSEHTGIVRTADSCDTDNGDHVKAISDTTKEDAVNLSGTTHVSMNVFDGSIGHEHDVIRGPGCTEKVTAEGNKLSAESQIIETAKAPDTRQSPSQSTRSSKILDERDDADRTRTRIDSKSLMTLTAKMEMVDAILPSGLVSVDDRTPDVVSLAPEPPLPLPPSTTRLANEITTGDPPIPPSSLPRSVAPSNSASTSTPASLSTSTSTSTVNSRSNSVGITGSMPNTNAPPQVHATPLSSSVPHSRRPSHEDGEITSSTPLKTYMPRSHTPPTQPRSFHVAHSSSSPSFGSTSSSTAPTPRWPAPPLTRSPLSNAAGPTPTPISSRPLPSGPRALRGSMTQPTHPPPYASARPPYASSQYIPRGPSADRERIDWERGDRQWATQARPRGRAGSNGWGR